MQTKLRTYDIIPNDNIRFPIGTILAVQNQYDKLGFHRVFGKYKTKGRDLNSLLMALVSYKLTENFSISRASEWINHKEVLEIFDLERFEEITLFRALESIGKSGSILGGNFQTFRTVCSRNIILSIQTSILIGQA